MDIGAEGYVCPDVGSFMPGHSADHFALWRGYLGSDPTHWKTTGEGPPQVSVVDIS